VTKRKATDFIAVHCTASPPSVDMDADDIRAIHTAPKGTPFDIAPGIVFHGRGWSDIGYHFVIRRQGHSEMGRPVMEIGAHVRGFNSRSVAVVLVGGVNAANVPTDNFTPAQWDVLTLLLRGLVATFPGAVVQGHRDFPNVHKACPSFDAIGWWAAHKDDDPHA